MKRSPPPDAHLSRRERQIMDVIHAMTRASAADVHERIPHPPTLTAVRTMLRNLESKGELRHEQDGPRHIYLPTVKRELAQRSAMAQTLRTFFGGSPKAALAALLDATERPLTKSERAELVALIQREREVGR